jgi:hypothetical protein
MTLRSSLPALLAAALSVFPATAQQSGITAETWSNLGTGKSILLLRDKGISARAPDATSVLATASLTGLPAGTGARLRGTLTPLVDDTYTFWVTGASNVALWISEDGSRFTKRLIASNLEPSGPTEWAKHPGQKSIPIALTAGTAYHIEAHVMSGAANGHLSIAWQGSEGNWAFAANGATATQSSTQWALDASKAIDGNTNGVWNQGTMTTNVQNSWLKVDFAATRPLNKIVLFNNSQNQNRLSNFRLSALDGSGTVLAQEDFFTTSGNVGNSFTWDMPATVEAASVKIQLLGNNLAGNGHLSLAEIQAYGPGPYEAMRDFQVISSAYLGAIAADPADLNDNHLPDAWEQQTGLAASSHPEALLEHGDPDKDGISNYDEHRYGSDPLLAESLADVLTRSVWTELSGNGSEGVFSMTNTGNRLRVLGYPNETTLVPGIDATLARKNFGARYRGSFIAPATGTYRFWLSASGDARLWIADGSVRHPDTDEPLTDRFGKRMLATSGHVTPLRDFDYSPSQRTAALHLIEGQEYYIEVLHNIAQANLDHVSVAWQVPGQTRAIMPAEAFRAIAPHANDADDDNLPDAWETANTLNPANNGLTSAADGEYGDPDGDGLTNLQEFQYGTNPFSADTDGDGYSDYDEIFLYGSDPTVSNLLAPASLILPPLNQYTTATGSWTTGANGSLSASDRRGAITYTFTVTEPGVHEIVVSAGAISPNPWVTKHLPLVLSLDGDAPLARKTLSSKNSDPDTLRAITPWLTAGSHTLTILHDNYAAAVRLRIDSVTVSRLGGADLDEDGVPDWIRENEVAANLLDRVPAESRTSPASIEGRTRQLSSATLSVLFPGAQQPDAVELNASVNTGFYAEIPLSEDGAVTLDASFLGGIVTDTRSLTWVATNLLEFDQSELHIRKGDSLRLTAHAPEEAPSGTFTLSGNHPVLPSGDLDAGEPHVLTSDTAGTYTLTATHGGQTATVTLVVHTADFGASHPVKVGKARPWSPPVLGPEALVESDERLVFTDTTTGGNRTFHVIHSEAANHHVIARLPAEIEGAPSAILARGTVHGFDVARVDQTGDARIVHRYADGTWLMSVTVVAVNLPPEIMIRLTAVNQGSLFTNGGTTLDLRAGDFDANGIATVYFEWAGATAPKLCHRVKLFVDP